MLRAVTSETLPQAWPWERMARSNAPSHELLVELLDPGPGERFLDVATGSGGVALRAARRGADVLGIDLASDAVEQAHAATASEGLRARFDVADMLALPYEDASFDIVASAFGVNFAPDHDRAAGEVARVCRPGGRLGLTLMPRDSRAGELWTLLRRLGAGGGDHPAAFADRVDELLGESFELERRLLEGEADELAAPGQAWQVLSESFDPLRELLERLDESAAAELRAEFLALRERFEGKPRTYVLVLGRRR
jgi:SAM-dependent methyltransferase